MKGAAYVIVFSFLGIAALLSVLTEDNEETILALCALLGIIMLISIGVLVMHGERKIEFDADKFTLQVPGGRYTIPYSDVLAVDMRNDLPRGTASASYRAGVPAGVGIPVSAQYAPIGIKLDQKVVVRHSRGTIVFSLDSEDETMMAFMTLRSKAARNVRNARARRPAAVAARPKSVQRPPSAGPLQAQMQAAANNQSNVAPPPVKNEPPKDFWSALFDSVYKWP
ncbi:MAG: hypothetical protein LBS92_07620 [Candidatus Methanoplasma sp.]|nr:hypothetical protein [Candidatus Methanoplasma sp.]